MMLIDKLQAGIMGSVIGDAIGVPYEFRSRNEMKYNPCTDIVGYGTYNKPIATWSDDSSMVLATMDSIVNKNFNLDKMMLNFIEWQVNGKYTQDGFMFSIGNTTATALNGYKNTLNTEICGQKGENSNGNGSLMRILPVAIYLYNKCGVTALRDEENINLVKKISALTHAHDICKEACLIYISVALHLLNEEGKDGIIKGMEEAKQFAKNKAFNRLFSSDFFKMAEDDLSGSGYVVNTLESSLYIAYNTSTYRESILTAVNLGNDTDTTASVTGGLTGILYGYEAIPQGWKDQIRNKDYVLVMCNKFINDIT